MVKKNKIIIDCGSKLGEERILINDIDISSIAMSISFNFNAGEYPELCIRVIPENILIKGSLPKKYIEIEEVLIDE